MGRDLVVQSGGRLRGGRRRADGGDEPTGHDAAERSAGGHDADPAADGGAAAARRPDGQLRPPDLSSYPGSPQGVPDLNIIPGLPSVSGYASIVNGNYESIDTHPRAGRPRHRRALVGHPRPARPAGGRDRARVLPGASAGVPRSFDGHHPDPENFGADPVLPRGYGADFNETAYPFDPGPAARARARADRLVVLRRDARARSGDRRPAATRRARDARCASGRCAPTGRPAGARRPVPVGATRRHGHLPRGARRRAVAPGPGGLAPTPAGGDLRGRPALRARWLAVVGARPGAVAGWPGSRRATPCSPFAGRRARHGDHRERSAAARVGRLEHDEVRTDQGRRARALDVAPFGGLGLGLDGDGLGRRGQAKTSRCARRPRPAGPHSGRRRRRDLPLPAAASVGGERPEPRRRRVLAGVPARLWPVRRAPPRPSAGGGRCREEQETAAIAADAPAQAQQKGCASVSRNSPSSAPHIPSMTKPASESSRFDALRRELGADLGQEVLALLEAAR